MKEATNNIVSGGTSSRSQICFVDVVFTDFCKAADKLDFRIFLSNFFSFGFDSNLYLILKDVYRKTFVAMDLSKAAFGRLDHGLLINKMVSVGSGVPLESILAPLFFILT